MLVRSDTWVEAVLFAVIATAASLPTAAEETDRLAPVVRVVTYLRADGQASKSKIGSGFFVESSKARYLVTADHVAGSLTANATATVQSRDGSPLTFSISDLVPPKTKPQWIHSEEADLAILRLATESEVLAAELNGHFLPIGMISNEHKAPPRFMTLTLIGFPFALGVEGIFSPISRETKAASGLLTLQIGDEKPSVFFVTQDPSVGGFSGAPVTDTGLPYSEGNTGVTIRFRTLQILGMAKGTIPDETGGKMGLIVPSYYIRDAIDRADSSGR